MINEKIIDTHLHIEAWENESGSFIDGFEEHREISGLKSMNICALPSHEGAANNIVAGFYKIAHPNTFAHGGVVHFVPTYEKEKEGFELVTQYKELMEIGFDGIKMLEGKPSYHKEIGKELNTPSMDALFDAIEKDGTHLVFHVNDPAEFWKRECVSQEIVDNGWFYGDGTYASHEELYRQAERVLEKHPSLKVTFAHFYFCGETPEKLSALFDKYPNMGVDLTPGTEMYTSFEKHHDFYRDFFIKYSDRIMLGTDGTFPLETRYHAWCIDILYRFIATDEKMMAFNDSILTGMNIKGEERENILYKNFERRVSEEPKPLNKVAFKAYIEKYLPTLTEENQERVKALTEKYL